jgi:hypothetical protein
MAALLDKSYPEPMKLHLGRMIQTSFNDIRKHLIDEFTPYGPRDAAQRDDLEKQWQALFDGEEVLPNVLLDRARSQSTWLGRARYMVPVPSRWLHRLNSAWDSELMCFVADADYNSDMGLKLRESIS